MKFLINESGGFVNWNGDVATLDTGVYYLVKKVETIRVVGGAAKRRDGIVSAVNDALSRESKWRENDVVEEKVSITEIPNNDKSAGKIRYWQGLRYVKNADGKLERFPASDEPQMFEGQMFSGYHAAGVFTWDYTQPAGFVEEKVVEPVPEPVPEPVVEAKPKKKKKQVIEEVDSEIEELNKLANEIQSAEPIDDVFDESAFLEDLAIKDEGGSKCWIESDNLTLAVEFEGQKYKKRFKSDKVAISQLEVFRSLLKEDVNMAKELLNGSMSTFTKA